MEAMFLRARTGPERIAGRLGATRSWRNSIWSYSCAHRGEVRLTRLRAREATHFGADVVAQGGWRHDETEAFIEWASITRMAAGEGRSAGEASRLARQTALPRAAPRWIAAAADLVAEAAARSSRATEARPAPLN